MRVLLDANAYTQLTRGDDTVVEIVEVADEVLFSAVVLGELLFGFRLGARTEENLAILRSYLDSPKVSVVDVGQVAAEHYGSISAALRAKGRPIPTNDTWIAAHTMETGAELVSADAHFEHVDGLSWVRVAAS